MSESAKWYAIGAHEGMAHKRKYTGDPYWYHCEEVADIVAACGLGSSVIAAAWLHDTVEDTRVTIEDIRQHFGTKTASVVSALTDVYTPETHPDMNRRARKAAEVDRYYIMQDGAWFEEIATVKLADLISNTKSIRKYDPKFAKVYLAEKRELLGALTPGDARLWAKAWELCHEE